jgi:hypothetical protein
LSLTNPAQSLPYRITAKEKFPRPPSAGFKMTKYYFGELLLDGSTAIDTAFDAPAGQSFRRLWGPNYVQDQNARTREKSGAGSWRLGQKQSHQQTANVNKY